MAEVPAPTRDSAPATGVLVLFLIAYFSATTVFQLRAETPVSLEGSPMDLMNGGLLWMGSAMALMNAALRFERPSRAALWLLGSAAIGLVALDEIFALHEHSVRVTGDDDDPKILLVSCAALGVLSVVWIERLRGPVLRLLLAGLAVHFTYLIVDLGDGDYFRLPVATGPLSWIEEYLELTSSALYFSALFVLAATRCRGERAQA